MLDDSCMLPVHGEGVVATVTGKRKGIIALVEL